MKLSTKKVEPSADEVKSLHLAEVQLKYRSLTNPTIQPEVKSPEDAVDYLREIWNMDTIELQEEFVILLLNASKRCIGWSRVSMGGITSTIVDPAHVFKIAILANAHSIVCAHNHPSGNLKASTSDIKLTERLIEAGKLLGISLEDHIIITLHDYLSMREKGLA